jgi:hypothetical protein
MRYCLPGEKDTILKGIYIPEGKYVSINQIQEEEDFLDDVNEYDESEEYETEENTNEIENTNESENTEEKEVDDEEEYEFTCRRAWTMSQERRTTRIRCRPAPWPGPIRAP